jgi:hypothetical protein
MNTRGRSRSDVYDGAIKKSGSQLLRRNISRTAVLEEPNLWNRFCLIVRSSGSTERERSVAKMCRELAMAHTLVPSDHVETASVYGRGDEKIGTIERLMLEKKSGTVAYAVVRCGGLLKGEVRHYPVPWDSLKYNVARKAYTTNLTLEELRSGPSELDGEAFDWGDRSAVYRHPQYWSV